METITFDNLPQAVSKLLNEVIEIKRLLVEQTKQQPIEQDRLLTIQQAAEFLNLAVPTLYSYVHNSHIPVSKRGKRLYFSRQELLQWVKEGRKKTCDEIAIEASAHIKKKGTCRAL